MGRGRADLNPIQLPGSAVTFSGSRGLQMSWSSLDMDVLGEQDTDVVVDGMSEAVLMSN
jgi:hypothetical protein